MTAASAMSLTARSARPSSRAAPAAASMNSARSATSIAPTVSSEPFNECDQWVIFAASRARTASSNPRDWSLTACRNSGTIRA